MFAGIAADGFVSDTKLGVLLGETEAPDPRLLLRPWRMCGVDGEASDAVCILDVIMGGIEPLEEIPPFLAGRAAVILEQVAK
jgi:hypothetical protein